MSKSERIPPHEGPPYLGVAAFCERAIQDTEGIFTIIRLFDELTLTIPEEYPGPSHEAPIPVTIAFFVGLKGIDQVPWQPLKLNLIGPDGGLHSEQPMEENPVTDKANLNIDTTMHIPVTMAGLYHVDVIIGDRLLTRIPLLVQVHRVPIGELTVGLRGVE